MMMKSHNIGIGTLALPVLQIPVFISAFMGIRKMCNLPVESMSEGGIWWFQNLTIADPTYILPTVSVLSIIAVVAVSKNNLFLTFKTMRILSELFKIARYRNWR
jgi:YidC/Oxa1 family membrane protein insertase